MPHSTSRRTLLLLLVGGLVVGCGEPHRDAAIRYHGAAQGVLIAHGVCANAQDCQKRQLLFWEGGRRDIPLFQEGGASLNLYETVNQELIESVGAKLKATQQAEHLPSVQLTVYSGPHANKGQKVRVIFISGAGTRGA